MNNLNLKPALRYQLIYIGHSSLAVFGILVAIAIFLTIFFGINVATTGDYADGATSINLFGAIVWQTGDLNVNVNAGIVFVFTLFVIGIGGIREDFRFFLQNGMGRRTVYMSTLLASLIAGVVLGFFNAILNLILANFAAFPLSGLTFVNAPVATVQSFFIGWILHALFFFLAWQLGALISLIYYRMKRIQQIVFSVAVGAIIIFGLPAFIINRLMLMSSEAEAMLQAFFTNETALTLPLLFFGALSAIGNFLLLRRAQVK